ncbi:MAG: hypothetical protein K8R74_17135, partial [Bacteroidales bacterium]|nr:hypothetical protein [Bacteroidales bacterium]
MKNLIYFLFLFLISSSVCSQDDYYWEGGQGNWSDLNSWRFENGLIPPEVPDASDNVIFNENSFYQQYDTVFIDNLNPVCNSMIWENIPFTVVLAGDSENSTLTINSSIKFHPNVINVYTGEVDFISTELGNEIQMCGNQFNNIIRFSGIGGEWILQDTLIVFDTSNWSERLDNWEMINPSPNPLIIVDNGTLNTNNHVLIAEGFMSTTSNNRNLLMNNSHFIILGNWYMSGENLNLDFTQSNITIRGTVNNYNSGYLVYNDIEILEPQGELSNSNVRTKMNRVHFKGNGFVNGKDIPGIQGSFTIDSLVFNGFDEYNLPVKCRIEKGLDSINYVEFNLVTSEIEINYSWFNQIEYNAFVPGYLKGSGNKISILKFNHAKGTLAGANEVNDLYFVTQGIISGRTNEQNIINNATFASDGVFAGNNTITNLFLNDGYAYTLQSDSLNSSGAPQMEYVLTISESLTLSGGCETGLASLSSDKKTVPAFLDYQGSILNTEFVMVSDIQNIGSSIQISNGIDLGNNAGFNFSNNLPPRSLFWVDGSGEWNDLNHWSLVSGGISGECPPTPIDNINFDENSGLAAGSTVNISSRNIYCDDIYWSNSVGTTIFSSSDTCHLHIFGSLQFSEDLIQDFKGNVYFESSDNITYEEIVLAGQEFFKQVHFYGSEGKWQLMDDLICTEDTLFVKMGTLNTNNHVINCYNLNSGDTLERSIFLGNSTIEINQSDGDVWVLNAHNLDFDAGSSTIVSKGHGSKIRSFGGELTYFNIEFADNAFPGISELFSESLCHYNVVDVKPYDSRISGAGNIDSLLIYSNLLIEDQYSINHLESWGIDTKLDGSHQVNNAVFHNSSMVYGNNTIEQSTFNSSTEINGDNTFGIAHFLSDGTIIGDNLFDQFHITANNEYVFGSGDTQIIAEEIIFDNNPNGWINLHSNMLGEQAILQKPEGDLTVEGAIVKDIRVDGNDLPVIAMNSIDLGNNTNWEFYLPEESTIYWVGGSGFWDDPDNWSFGSGGTSASVVPSIMSNVIFDDNSFISGTDSVMFNDEYGKMGMCKTMYWNSNISTQPVFIGNENTSLKILGSLFLTENINYQFEGIIEFIQIDGISLQTDSIQTAGNIFLNNVVFNGIDGSWILMDDLTFDISNLWYNTKDIYLVEGSLNTNSKKIQCGSVYSDYQTDRSLNIQNSTIELYKSNENAWLIDGDNLVFSGENSTISMEGEFATFKIKNGLSPTFGQIYLNGIIDSLININNQAYYDQIHLNGLVGYVEGEFSADSVFIKGSNSNVIGSPDINVLIANGELSAIQNSHIGRLLVYDHLFLLGSNYIEYGKLFEDVNFLGNNSFDTLIILPGSGEYLNAGNYFYFMSGSTQTITDSLYIRGNQCSNINLQSTNFSNLAYIKKDNGAFDVVCDFLNITGVAAESENLNFYAGANSTGLPINDPPPGWIFENGPSYLYGFGGSTIDGCYGDTVILDASCFNGGDSTQYYWNGSSEPGNITYE